jgi:hypothetical protein
MTPIGKVESVFFSDACEHADSKSPQTTKAIDHMRQPTRICLISKRVATTVYRQIEGKPNEKCSLSRLITEGSPERRFVSFAGNL